VCPLTCILALLLLSNWRTWRYHPRWYLCTLWHLASSSKTSSVLQGHHYLLIARTNKLLSVLVLFDLSIAFDTSA
jgi:hypothetical protein